MDLDYCTICSRETAQGELYCGAACRDFDTPASLRHLPQIGEPKRSSPATASATSTSGSSRPDFRFRTLSGSSDDEDSEEFILPSKRNLAHTRPGGPAAVAGATGGANGVSRLKAARENHHRARGPAFYGPGKRPGGGLPGAADEDLGDTEADFLMALTKPLGLDHREKAVSMLGIQLKKEVPPPQKTMAKYLFTKEFPGAF